MWEDVIYSLVRPLRTLRVRGFLPSLASHDACDGIWIDGSPLDDPETLDPLIPSLSQKLLKGRLPRRTKESKHLPPRTRIEEEQLTLALIAAM
jgi:hypothetical protein